MDMDTDKIEQLVEYEWKRVSSIKRLGVTEFIWNSERYEDRAELEAAIRKFVIAGQSEGHR
jgi:hypothetical protein